MGKKKTITEPEAVQPEIEEKGLSGKEELFCRYFVEDKECFDNATLSYANAYNIDLDSLSRELRMVDVPGKKRKVKQKKSDYRLKYDVCSVSGRRLLRKDKIRARCRELLLDMLDDKVQDSELSWLVLQNKKLDVKLNAIKAVQTLRKRIKDDEDREPIKVDITLQLGKVYGTKIAA